MEIFITGANGFLGRYLIDELQARGDRVRALVLPEEDATALEARGVAVHRGDIRRPETLIAPLQGAEGVFHLAAIMDVWRPLEVYRAINVTGTENVCRAALAAGVRRLVHVSSTSVYGTTTGRLATEEAPLAPFPDPYPVTKAEGDALVRRLAAEEGLPAVVVRPDQLFGPGDRMHFGAYAARLRAGRGFLIGSGRNALPLVDVTDVVQGLLLAFDRGAVGQAYNITNDERLTQAEFFGAIAQAIEVPAPRLHVPYAPLYAAAAACERVALLSGSRLSPPFTRLGVAFLGSEGRHAIDRARRELGYAPRVPLREAVRRAADWYLAQAPAEQAARPLAGRAALVTGASAGIGAATARELARRGASVVLAARRADALAEQVSAIEAAGGRAIAVPVDLADPAAIVRLAAAARAAYGPIDVLVNNAGVIWSEPLAESAAGDVAHLLAVNLQGALLLTREVLPEMLARRRGAIVSVGSVAGRVATEPVYSASKYGLRGFSLSLRRQLAGSGVSVSLVAPGNIRTAMTAGIEAAMPEPEVVARTIADLVLRPRREVIVPRRHTVLVWLETLLPGLADEAARRRHWSRVRVDYGQEAVAPVVPASPAATVRGPTAG